MNFITSDKDPNMGYGKHFISKNDKIPQTIAQQQDKLVCGEELKRQ